MNLSQRLCLLGVLITKMFLYSSVDQGQHELNITALLLFYLSSGITPQIKTPPSAVVVCIAKSTLSNRA